VSDQVRARAPETRLTEVEVADETLVLIADVSNEQAWIQSTETAAVEP